MFRFAKKVTDSLGLSYPDEYLVRIQHLKHLAEEEISKVIDTLLTKPQWIVGKSQKMTLSEAIKEAVWDGTNIVEVAAPLLTFPHATDDKWNGDIDHVDVISGIYFIFTGNPFYVTYGDHLLTKYRGAPQILPALEKILGSGFHVTMVNNPNKSPASRFLIVLPKNLNV